MAISLGTRRRSDSDGSSLVPDRIDHFDGDPDPSRLHAVSPERCCAAHRHGVHFSSRRHLDCSAGRRAHGAYRAGRRKRTRGWLVSGGQPRRHWHGWGCRRLAGCSFFQGNGRRRARPRHDGVSGSALFRFGCSPRHGRADQRAHAAPRTRHPFHGALGHSSVHDRPSGIAHRFRRHRQSLVSGRARLACEPRHGGAGHRPSEWRG